MLLQFSKYGKFKPGKHLKFYFQEQFSMKINGKLFGPIELPVRFKRSDINFLSQNSTRY